MSGNSTPYASPTSSRSSSIRSVKTPPNLHQNSADPAAGWLVQKFGGTSVGKFAVQIARDIVSHYLDQHKVAIVCSARSGTTKALGTTNLLLKAASEALRRPNAVLNGTGDPVSWVPGRETAPQTPFETPGDSPRPLSRSSKRTTSWSMTPIAESGSPSVAAATPPPQPSFSETVDTLKNEHIKAARESVRNPRLLLELEIEIERDCEALRAFLFAAQVIDEISPRSRDSIIGFGERLACKVMAAVLRDQGIDAEYVSLENVVPNVDDLDATNGTLGQEFYDRVGAAVAERIRQCGPRVPVVTGFFGPVPGSLLRQIGRGYTDLLAALLAAALPASELQIWKEVDGIFTADPRKVPTARLIPIISPEEAAELTYYGSEVVHPFTMEQVIRKKIPIRIKNVENPSGSGTVIHPDHNIDAPLAVDDAAAGDVALTTLSDLHDSAALANGSTNGVSAARSKLPTAVTIKERILVLNINSNRKSVSHGFLAGIFGTLDKYGVVVDLISTSEVHVSMAIQGGGTGQGGVDNRTLERLKKDLEKIGTVTVHEDMAILSLVGAQMRHMVGISGRLFSTLADGKVNIEMISQGASEINISCVIDGRDAVRALNLIHQSCLQIKPEGAKGRMGPWLF